GGGMWLMRDSLEEVFRVLAHPEGEGERLLVQMAKVLSSISRANSDLMKDELGELHEMARLLRSSSSLRGESRDTAIASLAIAFSLLLKNSPIADCLIRDATDRVKVESRESPSGREEEEGDNFSCTRQFKQEPPECEEASPAISPHADPLYLNLDSSIDEGINEEQVMKTCSSIKREREMMEIMKRRMIGSQSEMDEWPLKRKKNLKVEDDSTRINTTRTVNNNNVADASLLASSPSSIHFRCPLSSVGVCREEWPSKEECYYHVQLCHPDFALPFSCGECALSFRYKHELREHKEMRHSPPISIRSSLYLHKLYFTSKGMCPHCPFSSSSARLFLSHHSAEHASCPHPHVSCNDTLCRPRFKFSSLSQVIYHYGVMAACKGQCMIFKQ
ncbi:hypothetical protein PMAYCL1PPCAC_12625, partial [Pristionchus mayeri]